MRLFSRKLGQGPAIIILHGLFGMSDNWLGIAKVFAEKYTVYLPDQRNHGQSGHSAEHSYKLMADDLVKFYTENNIDSTFLIGHSMGGKVAMTFAMNNPNLVNKLVVVDIAPRSYISSYFGDYIQAMLALNVENLDSRKSAEKQLQEKLGISQITTQFLLKNLMRNSDNHFSWRLNLTALYDNLSSLMTGIGDGTPFPKETLFIKGGQSQYIVKADKILIKSFFPKAEIGIIQQAGHWVHADAPQEFITMVSQFLSK